MSFPRLAFPRANAPWGLACGAALAAGLFALPGRAVADDGGAGFNCAKATGAAEQAICADPVLRRLDHALAVAWRDALANTRYRTELQADQRRWLHQRDAECGERVACLRRAYALRLPALAGTSGAFSWAGEWQRLAWPGSDAELALTPALGGMLTVGIDAANGGNTGMFGASATPAADMAVFHADGDCTITLRRVHNQLQVEQNGSDSDCGAGAGVSFDGRYVRKGGPMPEWDLPALGVVASPDTDAAIRTLLGPDDYRALLLRANQVAHDPDVPGLTTFGVRGLYTSMEAALLQQPSGIVQVAILDDDEIRYYSSDPALATRLPEEFGAWLARFTRTVQMMSAPGRPTLDIVRKDG